MASSNKTTYFGLNVWSGSDTPKRIDYVNDNQIIDTALYNIQSSVTSIKILGIYATLAALQAAHPTGNIGDYYAVGTSSSNVIYTWSITTSAWINIGSISANTQTQMSVTVDSNGLKLVGDETTPDDGKFYGRLGGNKGYYKITPADGWISANETWTYASANTINVLSGATSKYQKGDRIRWKQGGAYKYGVLITVADTLLTLLSNTDFTVTTPTSITDNYYSHEQNPIGYPHWFNIAAPTWNTADIDNGSSGQPTTVTHKVKIDGDTLDGYIRGSGTKVATGWYIRYTPNYGVTPLFGYCIGSSNIGWSANDHGGMLTYTAGSINIICDSGVAIVDNQALSAVSARFSFEF